MVTLELEVWTKHCYSPQAVLPVPNWEGTTTLHLLNANSMEKRYKHGNKLDISMGGVQLEKMSISY